MARFDTTKPDGAESWFRAEYERRLEVLFDIQKDIAKFGIDTGYNANQVSDALDLLFTTFASEWFQYLLIGADGLVTAIVADSTIPWLDLDASGLTVRTRLVNRLS